MTAPRAMAVIPVRRPRSKRWPCDDWSAEARNVLKATKMSATHCPDEESRTGVIASSEARRTDPKVMHASSGVDPIVQLIAPADTAQAQT